MKIFRPSYKDKQTGQAKQCAVYYVTFKDLQGVRRRLSAYAYETKTQVLAIKLDELLGSVCPSREQLSWFEKTLLPKQIEKLSAWGLLSNKTVVENLNKTLAENLDDFCGELTVRRGPRYVKQVKSALKRIFDGCKFKTRTDIDGGAIYNLLDGWKKRPIRPISDRSFNCYLKLAKQFFGWMVKRGRLIANPCDSYGCIEKPQKTVQRRALSIDEQCKLLETAGNGPTHHNLTGYERKLVYALALQTGLRAGEIKALKVGSFNLTEGRVTLLGAYTKNKKEASIKLTPAMVIELKKFFAGKLPSIPAFKMPNQTSKMIKKDLEAAGIKYQTDDGVADFHSLRHTFITGFALRGVHPKEAQVAARHSSIGLTMDIYTHLQTETQDRILEAQPDILKRADLRTA